MARTLVDKLLRRDRILFRCCHAANTKTAEIEVHSILEKYGVPAWIDYKFYTVETIDLYVVGKTKDIRKLRALMRLAS